ncbi:MAG: PA14 domain-containing protein [Desulfobaccales bacterium]
MTDQPVRYAILRDGRDWEGVSTVGLQPEPDGAFALSRLPGTADGQPILLAPTGPPPGQFAVESSGLAVGPKNYLYLADTGSDRVIRLDLKCDHAEAELAGRSCINDAPGLFRSPRGLAVGSGKLHVADGGNKRIQVFRLPTLELVDIWEDGFQAPTCLTVDSRGRVYGLDGGRVRRFSASGQADDAYNAALADQPHFVSPICIAIGSGDALFLTDEQLPQVLRFNQTGSFSKMLQPGPDGPAHPRALAAYRDRLYVADADSGHIWVYDCLSEAYIGTLPGYRGPVAAMAVGEDGTLFIKPGAGAKYYRFDADAACVDSGTLEVGPLDAGEQSEWERVVIQAEALPGTEVGFQTYFSDKQDMPPAERDWHPAPSLDMLLRPYPRTGGNQMPARYLWLRVVLHSDDQRLSPRLHQVQAETTGKSYLDYLPAIYRRDDAPDGFLEAWLALFRSQLQDWELTLDDIHQLFDPAHTPESLLPWLARWLAFDLPRDMDIDGKRSVLKKVMELYSRRGTLHGLKDFIHLYTGVRPHLFEAFRERHIWQLEHNSWLGCNTGLAAALPDGMIVPGFTPTDQEYEGLWGEYYQGPNFDQLRKTRTDKMVDASAYNLPFTSADVPVFSVRWTGQVQPRFSELYTFYTSSANRVCLWVDGRKLVDTRVYQNQNEQSGTIALTAGRWYSIRLDCSGSHWDVMLSWSSRSQAKEVIPTNRLYAVWDEWANLEPESQDPAGTETVIVGQTVVGESGPLGASQYGQPLFSDTAHLFTVLIPAAEAPEASRREKLKSVIEAEKPAHTDFHLCLLKPRLRVGFQARIGIDSIIAGPPEAMDLGGALLGLESYLGDDKDEGKFGRVGQRSHIGQYTILD